MEKGKVMMIVIIALLVIILGTVAVVSVYVIGLVNADKSAEPPESGVTTHRDLDISEMQEVALGDPITTNLVPGADGKTKVAKIGVYVHLDKTADDSEDFSTVFTENINTARSIALSVISDSTPEELNGLDGKSTLAETIRTRLQEQFNTSLIADVFFQEWLIV